MSRRTRIIKHGQHVKGFSLIEMMVSMTVGLILMSGIIGVFANSVKSNADNLKHIRLNQELRAIMDVMSRDIRRAGYWSDADGTTNNPYGSITFSATNQCITYSYDDGDGDAVPENEDKFGFRLNSEAVEIREAKSISYDSLR